MLGWLVGFGAFVAVFVLLPLLFLKLLLGLIVTLVVLPFKILGLVFHIALTALGFVAKLLFGGLGLLAGLFGVLLLVLAIPLLPLLLLAGFVWAVAKALSGPVAAAV